MEPGPNDVPAPCARCASVQLHRPDAGGDLYCLRCLAGSSSEIDETPYGGGLQLGLYLKRAALTVVFLLIAVFAFAHACNAR